MVSQLCAMRHQTTNRAAYSPAEFAASCGKHPTWAYRLLYTNKIRAITELGRILIPASELERVLSLAQPYDPKPKTNPKVRVRAGNRERSVNGKRRFVVCQATRYRYQLRKTSATAEGGSKKGHFYKPLPKEFRRDGFNYRQIVSRRRRCNLRADMEGSEHSSGVMR